MEIRDPFSDSAAPSVVASVGSSAAHAAQGSIDGLPIRDSTYTRAPVKRRFKSYLLTGEYERPWVNDKRLKRIRVNNYIIWGFIVAGLAVSGYINYNATTQVHKHSVGGFGTGEFEWTTTDDRNVFIDQEGLHIVPTLTTDTTAITAAEITNGYTLNLTQASGDGTCTGTTNEACSRQLTPFSIGMMPTNNVYGSWPASGEIDISESRGNDISYANGGRDVMSSAIHWGPSSGLDAFWLSTRGKALRRTDFSKGFHTFGLEWSEDYIFTWVDNPLQQVMYWAFPKNTNMFQRGQFTGRTANNSLVTDPWSHTGRPNSPFDQSFYLILNVAVGGTNGWFADGIGNKPWTDAGHGASDFYAGMAQWYPTWANGSSRGMTVKYPLFS
uniref:Beta-1,3-glucan-binding protein n=1 Tax=Talaromyces marneffei PM1 TaxID=1077442 RepID=A0A093Y6A9_TALMA